MLDRVTAVPLPDWALLQRHATVPDRYTDSFAVDVEKVITLSDYARAFYGSWVFGLERAILMTAYRRRMPVGDALKIAEGQGERFAVWQLEARCEDEMLLADDSGRTRSWLAIEPFGQRTRLWFGSAVLPKPGSEISGLVNALMPVHKLYSRVLLGAARRRI